MLTDEEKAALNVKLSTRLRDLLLSEREEAKAAGIELNDFLFIACWGLVITAANVATSIITKAAGIDRKGEKYQVISSAVADQFLNAGKAILIEELRRQGVSPVLDGSQGLWSSPGKGTA